MERMLRPQGLFQSPQPKPFDWQQPYSPGPGSYQPGGQYAPSGQYPPNPYPQGGQYPPTGTFQQAAPPQAWTPAMGGLPQAPAPAPPGDQTQTGGGYLPGSQFPQGGAYPGPYGNGQYPTGQYPTGQYGQGQFPTGQFEPGIQYGPDGVPVSGGAGGPEFRASGRLPFKLPQGPLIPVAVAGVVAVVVVVALLLSTQGGGSSNASGSAPRSSTAAPTVTSSGASDLTQRQAATALSGLLPQSGTDHADVNAAVTNVQACGKGLPKDMRVFSRAAANRNILLSKLAQLPGRSALSAAMISDLTGAWQASATVDEDLAKWAATAAGHCDKGNPNDPNLSASYPFDDTASADKEAFVKLWNPLAHKDGLPRYTAGQL
jgi:hypothetical protein